MSPLRAPSMLVSVLLAGALGCGEAGTDPADDEGQAVHDVTTEVPDRRVPPDDSHAGAPESPDTTEDVPPGCAPQCPLAECGGENRCEGPCPPCPATVSCPGCPLRLVARDLQSGPDGLRRVTLDLVYAPVEGAGAPTVADVRIVMHGPVRVLGVVPGAALTDANKALAAAPGTDEPFQHTGDLLRVVVLSDEGHEVIGAGTWLSIDLGLGGAFEPATEPVWFTLDTSEAVLAPPGANLAAIVRGTEDPVSLWPE